MTEKRKHKRFQADIKIFCQLLGDGSLPDTGSPFCPVAFNCSAGGLGIITEDQLPPGLRIRFSIIALSAQEPIKATGQVVWCEEEDHLFHSGIRFDHLLPDSHLHLTEFIRDLEERSTFGEGRDQRS